MFGNTKGITINEPIPTNLEVYYDLNLTPEETLEISEISGVGESSEDLPLAEEEGLPQSEEGDGEVNIQTTLLGD